MGTRPMAGMAIEFIGEFSDEDYLYLKPGQLALITRVGTLNQDWWYRCPCGDGGALAGHVVHSTNPINITPSIVCPGGCHYNIKDGTIV